MTLKITEINQADIVQNICNEMAKSKTLSFDFLLPLFFRFNDKPLTLNNHFYMQSLFNRVMPPEVTYKTARQVAKSMCNAEHSILLAYALKHFHIMHIQPLKDMIQHFSTQYMDALIQDSPFSTSIMKSHGSSSWMKKTFKNGSSLLFSYAFTDCSRIRGKMAHCIKYDEYQNFDRSFEQIINRMTDAVSAGLDFRDALAVKQANKPLIARFGTPLTFENSLEQAWATSSQAEWGIPCLHCKHTNIPSLKFDLEKMMGPKHRKEPVTADTPGIVCAKCGKYIYTRMGRWIHFFPERRSTHAGYHVPQCIVPFHCESQEDWDTLQSNRFNRNISSLTSFYNEICGESYDHGTKLFSLQELKNVAVLDKKTDIDTHVKKIRAGQYIYWGLGIDWGGGGDSGLSKTCMAAGGMRPDGVIEVFCGHRSPIPNEYNKEAARIIKYGATIGAQFYGMDFQGTGGRMRWDKMLESGLPRNMTIPISYISTGNGVPAVIKPATKGTPSYVQLNKARGFLTISMLIRAERILFFEFDYKDRNDPGLLFEFTSLVEERAKFASRGEIYRIIHDESIGPDDFADAVNYLVCSIYTRHGQWPDTKGLLSKADLSPEQQDMIFGSEFGLDWLTQEQES